MRDRRFRRVHAVITLCAVLAVLPRAGSAQVDSMRVAAIERNHDLMEEIMHRTGVPGMSAAVGREGEVVWAEGFGFAHLELRVPVDEETLFRIGSVSKPLTAAAVALLVQDGLLDLDAPVQTYLPDFPSKRWPITTREVAGHIAGIRHYRDNEFLSAIRYETVGEGLKIFESDSLLFEPGERFSYSSYGWNLVSAVVEGAAGEPFLDYMQRSVFDRLDLDHTAADWTDRIIPGRTAFYEGRRDGRFYNAPFVDNSYKWAGGGFLSTPSDLVKFAMAHSDPDFLRAEVTAAIWTPMVLDSGDSTDYGLGWFIGRDSRGRRVVSHGGGSVGGTTFLIYWPDDDVAVALVSNARGPTTPEAAEALAAPYLEPEILRESSADIATGEYTCEVAGREGDPEPLLIRLLGSPGRYWGRVDFREGQQEIIGVHATGDTLRITTIEDGGWLANLVLHPEAAGRTGHRNGRPMSCTTR